MLLQAGQPRQTCCQSGTPDITYFPISPYPSPVATQKPGHVQPRLTTLVATPVATPIIIATFIISVRVTSILDRVS